MAALKVIKGNTYIVRKTTTGETNGSVWQMVALTVAGEKKSATCFMREINPEIKANCGLQVDELTAFSVSRKQDQSGNWHDAYTCEIEAHITDAPAVDAGDDLPDW